MSYYISQNSFWTLDNSFIGTSDTTKQRFISDTEEVCTGRAACITLCNFHNLLFALSSQNIEANSRTSKQINGKDFSDFLVTVKYGSNEIPAVSGNVFVDYYN